MPDSATIEIDPDDIPAEALDSEPQLAPNGDAAPKRGRPKGSRNRFTSTLKSTVSGGRAVRRGSKAWVTAQCASIVAMLNLGLVFVSREDALNESEMTLLSDGLAAEAMSSERVMNWLYAANVVTPHLLMVRALVQIAIPRLQRRGIIPRPSMSPEEMNEFVRASTPAPETATSTNQTGAPVPVETGGTFEPNGGHWQR